MLPVLGIANFGVKTSLGGNNGPVAESVRKAYFLVGPTAVGKTALAQFIAEEHGYEIISADAMLVYTGMDIGTAKPSAAERTRVVYHGVDLTTPDRSFSVGSYLQSLRLSLKSEGGCPESPAAGSGTASSGSASPRLLVVGGTGLYLKALICGLSELPPQNPSLRAYWTDVLEEQGIGALEAALKEKSPGLYAALRDKQNPRRLIRALELADAGVTKVPRAWGDLPDGVVLCGLRISGHDLNARIQARVEEMYRRGLVEEVRQLRLRYGTLSQTARQAIGYAEAADYLDGRCSLTEAMERTAGRTRRFAKRQRTWFAHQLPVRWIDIDPAMDIGQVASLVLEHWRQYGPVPIVV